MADDKPHDVTVEILTLLSHRTKRGLVEMRLNAERMQMDVAKAKHVHRMLGEAIEAAISDELIYTFLTQRVGLSDDQAARALLDFRELRQGSREVVFPN